MKIGIFNHHSIADKDLALLAQRAEELGFDSFWLREHPIVPVVTTRPVLDVLSQTVDPFIALARASAVTKTIKLGTSDLRGPRAQPPPAGQGGGDSGPFLRWSVSLRHRRGLDSGGVGDYGDRLGAPVDADP